MPSIINRRGRPPHPDVLTPAEWQVLEGVRAGRTNQEIADELGVTFHTVKFHVSNMLAKLQLQDRQQLASWRPAVVEEAPTPHWRAVLPLGGLKFLGGVAAGTAAVIVVAAVAVLSRSGDDDTPPAADPSATKQPSPTRVIATPTVSAGAAETPAGSPTPAEGVVWEPDSTKGVETTVLVHGRAFTRLTFAIRLPADSLLQGTHSQPVELSVTAYNGVEVVALEARSTSYFYQYGSPPVSDEQMLMLTLDTGPIPAGTTAVAVEVLRFTQVQRRPEGNLVVGDLFGPFRGVTEVGSAVPLTLDLSDRAPARIDTGFGWAYLIEGIEREGTSLWVTYRAEGALQGLIPEGRPPDGGWPGPDGYLSYWGNRTHTESIHVPEGSTSARLWFGGASRGTALETGEWKYIVPVD